MTNPAPILTLQLSPRDRGRHRLRLSFAGLLSVEMPAERRRRLLGLLCSWPRRAAAFADASGSWERTDAPKNVGRGFEPSFVVHEVRCG